MTDQPVAAPPNPLDPEVQEHWGDTVYNPVGQLDRIEACLEAVNEKLGRFVDAYNSHTEILNWLKQEGEGLFTVIRMMGTMGPGGLMAAMKGGVDNAGS